ncbi:proline-, glutamic acid- and leucine-rich protein 1-like [Oppia nitens]|uniref:proline-, glutamic acid- and leucine-rich protein 1-like n=1 Tax=Oppia nitens TaxID=1686743 RepID=UPI0023DBFFF9|nr:proline-, glutamic acid- and leucine-rich protein 1-like [Oppia nitens]
MIIRLAIICLVSLLLFNIKLSDAAPRPFVELDFDGQDMSKSDIKMQKVDQDCDDDGSPQNYAAPDECADMKMPKQIQEIPQDTLVKLLKRENETGTTEYLTEIIPTQVCTEIINMEPLTSETIETITVLDTGDDSDSLTTTPRNVKPRSMNDDVNSDGNGNGQGMFTWEPEVSTPAEDEECEDEGPYDTPPHLGEPGFHPPHEVQPYAAAGGQLGDCLPQPPPDCDSLPPPPPPSPLLPPPPPFAPRSLQPSQKPLMKYPTKGRKYKTVTRKRIWMQRRRKIRRKINRPVLIITRKLVKEKMIFERIVPKIIETREIVDRKEVKELIEEGPKEQLGDVDGDDDGAGLEGDGVEDVYECDTGAVQPPSNYNQPPPAIGPPDAPVQPRSLSPDPGCDNQQNQYYSQYGDPAKVAAQPAQQPPPGAKNGKGAAAAAPVADSGASASTTEESAASSAAEESSPSSAAEESTASTAAEESPEDKPLKAQAPAAKAKITKPPKGKKG